MKYYFGIDFGTTNSAVVAIVYDKNWNRTLTFGDEYENPFPSLIAIDKSDGKVYCGRKAWEVRRKLQETCEIISSVKTYLGEDKTWKINGRLWTPEEIAAQLFIALKENVKEQYDIDMYETVVSIPVGFSPKKREALRAAANLAGIKISSFISESTGAIFKNYKKIKPFRNIAVFDWGGGTLDVSVVENINGKINELAIKGEKLGGDDIDLKLARWAHSKIMKDKGGNLRFEDMDLNMQDNMIVKCENAKKQLADDDVALITIPSYGEFGYVRIPINIDTFSLLIEPEIDKAIECFNDAIKLANLSIHEIDCIIMVGGSSHLAPLQERIDKVWKDIYIEFPEDAEWNVAKGAALLNLSPGNIRLNQDIGLKLSDETFYPIVSKDTIANQNVKEDTFGIIREEEEARFVFSDGIKNLGYKTVPTYGFFQENIKCKSYVNENLVFNIDIKSNNKPQNYETNWQYYNLKFYYELPPQNINIDEEELAYE